MRRTFVPLIVAVMLIMFGGIASASPIVFSGSSGSYAASVSFELVGDILSIVLTNTSTADVTAPIDVLTGAYFNLSGFASATPLSAVLSPGSTVLFGTTDPGGVVGGEWAVTCGLVGAPGGGLCGISSAGMGLFAPTANFPGTNLQGPDEVDGLQFGITSAGDNPATGNTPVKGANALIQNGVVLSFRVPTGFVLVPGNVWFQNGTALGDPSFPGDTVDPSGSPVPEPETLGLMVIGFGLLGLSRVLKLKKASC